MQLGLTDRIACPRCGPDFGLILLAEEISHRRVLEGELGCSNCRGTYPVRTGYADLRVAPRATPSSNPSVVDPSSSDPDETLRLGALLGVTEGPGTLLVRGPSTRHAKKLAELIGGIEVVVMGGELTDDLESEGVSRIIAHGRIPFYSDTFRGILLSGQIEEGDLEEAARSVAPSGRIVLLHAPDGTAGQAEGLGLRVLLKEDGVLVALKEWSRSLPLVTLRGR